MHIYEALGAVAPADTAAEVVDTGAVASTVADALSTAAPVGLTAVVGAALFTAISVVPRIVDSLQRAKTKRMELKLHAEANRDYSNLVRDLAKDFKLKGAEGIEAVAALIAVGPSFGPRAGAAPPGQPTAVSAPAADEPEPGPGDVPPSPPKLRGLP